MGTVSLLLLAGCLPELPDLADPCGPWPDESKLYRIDVETDKTRKPYVYVPSKDPGPRDIVVLLHGAGASGPKFEEVSQFEALADKKGFVLVYPNGLGWPVRIWNAGPNFGTDTNDLLFLDTLTREVSDKVCGRRIFAVGFSNGAMMAHLWGCQGNFPPDAIAVASGPLMVTDCDTAKPTAVRHYHGTDDTIVPMLGGEGTSGKGILFPSVFDMMETWLDVNACTDEEPVMTENGDTECAAWSCAVPTELCLIHGWPHLWPGGVRSSGTDADITLASWEFCDSSVPIETPEDTGSQVP